MAANEVVIYTTLCRLRPSHYKRCTYFIILQPIIAAYCPQLISGAFLNAEYNPAIGLYYPVYLKINEDIVPYWVKQEPNAVPYVSSTGELIPLLDQFLYGLKTFP